MAQYLSGNIPYYSVYPVLCLQKIDCCATNCVPRPASSSTHGARLHKHTFGPPPEVAGSGASVIQSVFLCTIDSLVVLSQITKRLIVIFLTKRLWGIVSTPDIALVAMVSCERWLTYICTLRNRVIPCLVIGFWDQNTMVCAGAMPTTRV